MGKKGYNNESKGRDNLENVGYEVERPVHKKFNRTDFYGLFDLIAIHPCGKIKLIQIKSNRASGINDFVEECSERMPLHMENIDIEFWVHYDREGWRIIEISNDQYENILDERGENENIGVLNERRLEEELENF